MSRRHRNELFEMILEAFSESVFECIHQNLPLAGEEPPWIILDESSKPKRTPVIAGEPNDLSFSIEDGNCHRASKVSHRHRESLRRMRSGFDHADDDLAVAIACEAKASRGGCFTMTAQDAIVDHPETIAPLVRMVVPVVPWVAVRSPPNVPEDDAASAVP